MSAAEMAIGLGKVVKRLFTSEKGMGYTDILIEPNQHWKARRAGQQWEEVIDPDTGGPVVYSDDRFNSAMAMFFSEDGETANYKWKDIVRAKGGSAYPVINMRIEEPVEAPPPPHFASSSDDDSGVMQPLPAMAEPPAVEKVYRLRMTVQRQGGGNYGAMLRCLREVPESLTHLGLDEASITTLLQEQSGLILVVGQTGAGKSTTIAGMVNQVNMTKQAHIATIEEPIEYVHVRKKSAISPREVGTDCDTYSDGVKQALRYVPDYLVIGEIRDAETMRDAVHAAGSGILVIATLHAANTVGAVRKAYGYLTSEGDRIGLSGNLVGVIAQALVPTQSGGTALAYELLDCRSAGQASPSRKATIQDVISEAIQGGGEKPFQEFAEKFRDSQAGGPLSQSFLSNLQNMVKHGMIDAKRAAMVPSDRQTQIRLIQMANQSR